MKRFSYDAVKSRLTKRMEMDSNSATILDDGAFGNLMDVFSEGISEVARYMEYALLEKKWKTAQNISSLTAMGSLIGRKRQRAKSAIGYIIVSHTDESGVNRLANFGSTFFDLDETSDYDDIEKNEDADYIAKSALVPWTSKHVYEVPKGTIFTASNKTQYISIKSVKSRILGTAYSTIKANSTKLESFNEAGGWDGIKYLKIPVIQGIVKNALLGTTDGSRFQSFSFDSTGVENASNSISKNYFYIEVIPPSSKTTEKWAEIQNIRLAGPYDKVYEQQLSEDGTKIIIKFGAGTSGKVPESGSTINIYYLDTLGEAGNIEQKGQITTMAFPTGTQMIDPRTNTISAFLSCTNNVTIMGGKDIEDEDDYKINAPVSYLSSYSTAVKKAYEKQIMNNSPISLSKIICYPTTSFIAKQNDTTKDEDVTEEVANEISVISNALNISAVKANGDKLEDSESEDFLKTVIKTIGDTKGPNDSFIYTEPNFIKIAPSVKVNTYDIDTSASEIYENVKTAISAEYSIFNTDFKEPLHQSTIGHIASKFSFTDSVNVTIEALANVNNDSDKMKFMNIYADGVNRCLVAIPFNFDKVFASNQYNLGFKNAYSDSPYLLKVDLLFKNTSSTVAESKKRTFFLFDNRTKLNQTLSEAYTADLANVSLKKSSAQVSDAEANIGRKLVYFNETAENFNDRNIRVAQFPYISEITDETLMGNAKSYQTAPYENRPYEVDGEGKNKIFNVSDVSASLRVGLDGKAVTDDTSITSVYKRNAAYIDYVDIVFNENYDDSESLDYANGYFIIPVDYFGFDLPAYKSTEPSATSYIPPFTTYLKSYVDLKVYALPKQTDIEPENYNDICFIDDDDIRVEKVLKSK